MIINGKNYLLIERRGCEFFENDETVAMSDVGNYRLFVEFTDKNGTQVCGELVRFDLRDYSKKSQPVIRRNVLSAWLCYHNDEGYWGYTPEIKTEQYTYNMADIMAFINGISAEQYDDYKWVHTFTVTLPSGSNFVPSDLIRQYAKDGRLETTNTLDGVVLHIYTGDYKYLCYEITQSESGDTVKVYLERV